jgi:hypothetical protein
MFVSQSNLRFLAAVESFKCDVLSRDVLPSWVPDWSKKETLASHIMRARDPDFNAGKHWPLAPDNDAYISGDVLCLHGIFVATVTQTYVTRVNCGRGVEDHIKLMKYDRSRKSCAWPTSQTSGMIIVNTSWAPWGAETGDIIIVVQGSRLPLVLRPTGGDYLFVGCCWLIVSELTNFHFVRRKDGVSKKAENDAGFSRIMFGSAWFVVKHDEVLEEFRLR